MNTIKKSTNYNQSQQCEKVAKKIQDIIDQSKEDIPVEILNELKVVLEKIKSYKFEMKKEKINLIGDMLTAKEIVYMLREASGTENWFGGEEKVNTQTEYLKKQFDVDFAQNEIREYHFSRRVHSKHDIWLMRFICVPGHTLIEYDTRSINGNSGELLSNATVINYLKYVFE